LCWNENNCMVRSLRFLAAASLLSFVVVAVLAPAGCANGSNPASTPGADASSGSSSGGSMADATASDSSDAQSSGGCMDNSDCANSTTGHVCVAGSCDVCGTSADCPMGQKCNGHTACVACLSGADCSAGERCVSNACAMGCDATSTCPANMVCDLKTNACVGCLANGDCTPDGGGPADAGDAGALPTSKCNTTTSTCVQCLATSDCPTGDVCQGNACVPGCTGTQKCPTGSVCDYADAGTSGTGACVGCLANSDCHVPTPWCDSMTNTCVQCTPSNPSCPTAQYCAGTTCAPGCNTNADCTADGGLVGGGGGGDAGDAGGDAAADGGDGGSGGSGGAICDTQNHSCVQCVTDNNCQLGETCQGNKCLPGCDVGHGCPFGSGCCNSLCVALNTTSNCTACGVTCDTTSGNSQGAACGASGCTYTGCAAGFGDCNSTAPDSDGCETNLTTTNEKVCGDGTCVQNGTCCAVSDCMTPPTPASCYPAQGTCVEGQVCQYPENTGSVVCGSTCCNAINGTCSNSCSLTCNNGFGHCVGDTSKGCETNTGSSTVNCGACARGCNNSHTSALSCASGVCNSTCQAGWGNCNEPAGSTVDDGCESNLTTCPAGTPCCGTLCQVPHKDGEGQTYSDCTDATGTPGTASTYNQNMATQAALVYPPPAGNSLFIVTCGSETAMDLCDPTGATCYASWCYTGACAGYVLIEAGGHSTYCPNGTSGQTWD